ncbi:MAG: 30S ribosomal protein S27e [Candidatus Thermoplasmatota archaeon]|nr:30S ribosomal protein S27e [Candidatus Thermoplasmatota archaeon]MEE3134381.1 30S ribosomal protein S27e [Candidatus Thermoplasmatota archaeon]
MRKIPSNFIRVKCQSCGNESTIFQRASTTINCEVCEAIMVEPAGGKARLVGCSIVEVLESA